MSAEIIKRNISAIRRAFELWAGPDRVNVQYLQEAYWAWPCQPIFNIVVSKRLILNAIKIRVALQTEAAASHGRPPGLSVIG